MDSNHIVDKTGIEFVFFFDKFSFQTYSLYHVRQIKKKKKRKKLKVMYQLNIGIENN